MLAIRNCHRGGLGILSDIILNRLAKSSLPVRHSSSSTSCCSYVDPCPRQKYMDVKCKVALITGGVSGIGLAIADSLLNRGLKKAVISGLTEKNGLSALEFLIKRHGQGRVEFEMLDVRNHKQFEDVYKDILYKEGHLDILVNNAGVLMEAQWQKTIDINLKGVIQGIILANKYMPSQPGRGGCVVNTASILGFDVFAYAPVYTGTKHAIIGLTKSFGAEENYKKTGVRLLALCPGVTHTSLFGPIEQHLFDPELGKATQKALFSLPKQSAESTGSGTVYMVEYGPPGSLWVVEESLLARVTPPHRSTYLKKVLDL